MQFKLSNTILAVTAVSLVWLLCALAPATASAAKRTLPAFIAGADLSLLPVMEKQGIVYKDAGSAQGALKIFRSHGFNCVRLRLWAHPSQNGVLVNDLPYTIALGKRVKQAGFLLLLDIHYSDTWADPGKQFKPADWNNLPTDLLVAQVHDYTRDVVAAMRKADAMPDIVQIGNEIIGGMLWPDGKDWGPGHDFKTLGLLLNAGIRGADDGSGPLAHPLIMIHIDRGGDWGGTKWFFDGINAQGVNYDIIGESFYPKLHGPISALKETLQNAAARYNKPIIVVETAYPYRDDPPTKGLTYPVTPDGQRQYIQDLIATVKDTPGGLGLGVCYWEPEWLPTKLVGAWSSTALFDDNGNALPALNAFNPTPKLTTNIR